MRITAEARAAMSITTTTRPTSTIVVRGTTILFEAAFTDRNGDSIDPDSASVQVAYLRHGAEQTDVAPMLLTGGKWQAVWQSERADAGIVAYSITATAGDDEARRDGELRLTANGANPPPA